MSEKQNSGLTVAVLVIPNLIVCLASTVSYSLPYMFGSLIGRVLCTYLFFCLFRFLFAKLAKKPGLLAAPAVLAYITFYSLLFAGN